MSLVKEAQVRLENAMTQRPSHTLTMRAAVADVQAILSDRERLQSELDALKEELDVTQDSRDRLEERRLKAERELAAANERAEKLRDVLRGTSAGLIAETDVLDGHEWVTSGGTEIEWCAWCGTHKVDVTDWLDNPKCEGFAAVREALRSTPQTPRGTAALTSAKTVAVPVVGSESAGSSLSGDDCTLATEGVPSAGSERTLLAAQEPKPLPHHCGLTGFNPMKDEPCPACVERHTYVPKTDQPGLDKCGFPVRRLVIGGRDVGYQHCGGPKSAHQPGKDQAEGERRKAPPHPGAIGAIPPDWEDKRKAQPCGHPMSDQKSEGRCKHGCVYGCFSG